MRFLIQNLSVAAAVDTHGESNPEKFDERYPLVQEIFNSITFTN
jgi:hypothetical protein